MAKPLKKRPIEKELKFLANFELYGALMFTGMYFAAKYIVDMDLGEKAFQLNWISFYPLLIFSVIAGIIVGILLYFMAVIEQINYFHIRLSYETVNGRLLVIEPLKKLFTGTGKRPQLRKDIDTYLKG